MSYIRIEIEGHSGDFLNSRNFEVIRLCDSWGAELDRSSGSISSFFSALYREFNYCGIVPSQATKLLIQVSERVCPLLEIPHRSNDGLYLTRQITKYYSSQSDFNPNSVQDVQRLLGEVALEKYSLLSNYGHRRLADSTKHRFQQNLSVEDIRGRALLEAKINYMPSEPAPFRAISASNARTEKAKKVLLLL
jgi:hypothetical protein